MSNENEENMCNLCREKREPNHNNSVTHRFNFILCEWNKYRKKTVKDKNNVTVSAKLVDFVNGTRLRYIEDKASGTCTTKATVAQANVQNVNGINFLITVRNTHQSRTVMLVKLYTLHPNPSFQLVQVEGAEDIKATKELLPGATYSFKVRYRPQEISVGSFKMPVMIKLQIRNDISFSVGREMVIIVSDEDDSDFDFQLNKVSPFTSVPWEDKVSTWLESRTVYRKRPDYYRIPKQYDKLLKFGLNDIKGLSERECITLDQLREKVEGGYPTKHNYKDYFHILLWLDEKGAALMLRRYNMERVTMTRLPGDFLELEVPGLAEKRPSLIRGDLVKLRFHADHIGYEGVIDAVNDKNIWIGGVDEELIEQIENIPNSELDVSFQLGRLSYERMHTAIDRCIKTGMIDYLFPDENVYLGHTSDRYDISNDSFFNLDIINNEEQKRAVLNILNCKSGRAPYILFGPPGTGKTITIVEAILQIKEHTGKRILICAPSNAACDWIAEKLINTGKCSKKQLLRLHSSSRDMVTVSDCVKAYSKAFNENFEIFEETDLVEYRIIISTLTNIGRYSSKHIYCPDFVFIDEAGQALEPEALIAISLLTPGQQVVLAGDPQQLGPICSSAVAEGLKLGVSLLERLMKMPIYESGDPNFITMLKLNFRAHPDVLHLPNELFYKGKLEAVSKYAKNDPIANISIYSKICNGVNCVGYPVEFCSVIAKEKREGNSPSYFNEKEIEMVIKYVKMLLCIREAKVTPEQIGIVTPYIRQVYRIKQRLKQKYPEIDIGTAESFQGREKRIIIVSTVRAQDCLLLYDKQYNLGFVKNKKRFNVALTRAMSKLIVIGCPNVLRYDKECWLKYIDFCKEKRSYFGGEMDRRTDALKMNVINRMQNIETIPKKPK